MAGHHNIDGVVVATQRRVHRGNADRFPDRSSIVITLDIADIEVR
jgi:hypothetical protein